MRFPRGSGCKPPIDSAAPRRFGSAGRSGAASERTYRPSREYLRAGAETPLPLAPDLNVKANLCEVCARAGHDLPRALSRFPGGNQPQVVHLTARNLEEVWKGN